MSYFRYIHQATAWERDGVDAIGRPKWKEPVVTDCRWEDTERVFTGPDGRQERSRSVIYHDKSLGNGWKIKKGVHTNTEPPDDAYEIRSYREMPDLFGNRVEKRSIL